MWILGLSRLLKFIVTGRNEVLAEVIYLHLSVIHSVHRGVSNFWGVSNFLGVSNFSGGFQFFREVSNYSGGLQFFGGGIFLISSFLRIHPPLDQTPEYGQRSAGTHPTGMHSCSLFVSLFEFRSPPEHITWTDNFLGVSSNLS